MLPFLNDSKSAKLDNESNVINSFDQSITFSKNHPNDDDSIDVCNHKCQGISTKLLVSHEDFNLGPESYLTKEDVLIETSSSFHDSLCSTICDASTCGEDTPCSSRL